jgi:four helix bundle protein
MSRQWAKREAPIAKGMAHGATCQESETKVGGVKFRFEDLEIWLMAIEVADVLFDVADELEAKKFYRFAEQLRGASLSMANNIAEGAGSTSNREFAQFLNIARRSTFENANMLIIFDRRNLVTRARRDQLLERLDHLSRKITSFQRTLTRKEHGV